MEELAAKCPNHGVRLLKTGTPGFGQCPVSGAIFKYAEKKGKSEKKMALNSYGELVEEKQFDVIGPDDTK